MERQDFWAPADQPCQDPAPELVIVLAQDEAWLDREARVARRFPRDREVHDARRLEFVEARARRRVELRAAEIAVGDAEGRPQQPVVEFGLERDVAGGAPAVCAELIPRPTTNFLLVVLSPFFQLMR